MKKAIFTILILLSSSSMFAALPPLYQSLREIDAVISDERMAEYFTSADYIEVIKRNEEGFLITSNKRMVQVDVEYIPAKMVGPSKFQLHFHEAQDIE